MMIVMNGAGEREKIGGGCQSVNRCKSVNMNADTYTNKRRCGWMALRECDTLSGSATDENDDALTLMTMILGQ